jgi:ribonuclease E
MFNPTVQLKSGGYIVIGVTEALVAVDVNSGRATKEGSIEETALKTNLEAADEVARQLRLRDLAGLIVIDFIDMDERRNNAAVEKRLKDKLKTDRARIQVGRISGFGLLEMSRQRLRPGMLESTTQPCSHCHGTGIIRSDDSLALSVLRAIEEEGTRKRSREVLVRAPVAVANYLINAKREHIASIEARYGMSVRIEAAPELISPDFTMEKLKTATRLVPEVSSAAVSATASLMAEIDQNDDDAAIEEAEIVEAEAETPELSEDEQPKKKRRRRRRKKRSNGDEATQNGEEGDTQDASETPAQEDAQPVAAPVEADAAGEAVPAVSEETAEEAPKPKRRTRSRKKVEAPVTEGEAVAEAAPATEAAEPAAEEEAPKPKRRTRSRKKVEPDAEAQAVAEGEAEAPVAEEAPKPKRRTRTRKKPEPVASEAVETPDVPVTPQPDAPVETPPAPQPDAPVETPPAPSEMPVQVPDETPATPPSEAPVEMPPEAPPEAPIEIPQGDTMVETKPEPAKSRRRGWWSRG